MVWLTFLKVLERISLKKSAKRMGAGKPNTNRSALMISVFFVTSQNFSSANNTEKLENRGVIQGLPKMPYCGQ